MSKKLFILVIVSILLSGVVFIKNQSRDQFSNYKTISTQIGDKQFKLYVADTPDKEEKGLSGSFPLAQNEGMLFVFPKKDYYSFWMKGMKYPLDLIFIDGETVVDVLQNLEPSTYPQTFTARSPFQKAVEIKATKNNLENLINSQVGFKD